MSIEVKLCNEEILLNRCDRSIEDDLKDLKYRLLVLHEKITPFSSEEERLFKKLNKACEDLYKVLQKNKR